jgi:hypothetical protein
VTSGFVLDMDLCPQVIAERVSHPCHVSAVNVRSQRYPCPVLQLRHWRMFVCTCLYVHGTTGTAQPGKMLCMIMLGSVLLLLHTACTRSLCGVYW